MMNNPIYKNPPFVFAVGLNHRSAPLEIRERMFFRNEEIPGLLDSFKDILSECMMISTCNRTEFYGVTWNDDFQIERVKNRLVEYKNAELSPGRDYFYEFIFSDAASHLFKVAASIDSMVIGDSQIMNQVKEAYRIATENGSMGKILNQLVQKALHAAKRAKSETKLFEGAFSISYAAVELATKIFGDLKGKNILVIGAGKTSELTIHNLARKNAPKIYVTNRTRANAESLAQRLSERYSVDATVIGYDIFKSVLNQMDVIISSTGSGNFILNYDEFKKTLKERHGKPVFLIDIAVPRDIDPEINKLGNVFLKNIDDLNALVDSNYDRRVSVVPEVNEIVSQEVSEFLNWYYTIPVLPAIQYVQSNCDTGESGEMKRIRGYISSNVSNLQKNGTHYMPSELMKTTTGHKELVRGLHELNLNTLNLCYQVASGELEICPKAQRKCPVKTE